MPPQERPIIFSADMVNAIQRGEKTQTRRVILPQPIRVSDDWDEDAEPGDRVLYRGWPHDLRESTGRNKRATGELTPVRVRCPYGKPGDILYVKEAWSVIWTKHEPCEGETIWDVPHRIEYKADTGAKYPGDWPYDCGDDPECPKWKSGRFMAKRAARIWLEVTDIRAQRVQEISHEDAEAEGVGSWWDSLLGMAGIERRRKIESKWGVVGRSHTSIHLFQMLWDSINLKRGFGWCTNPHVWVLSFKMV